jgi:fructokinase
MRKVIGIGETILDIIFRNEQPIAAVPGGAVFNGMVSLRRLGVDICFISETGEDKVGQMILRYLEENQISTDHINVFHEGESPVSLAFLGDGSAEYMFYKNYPAQRLDMDFPPIEEDDILLFGSYYALNPVLRSRMVELLQLAKERKAIIYYDPNFRSAHRNEAMKLNTAIIEDLEFADIVRGSNVDLYYMYGSKEVDRIYKDKIKFYCPIFLCTAGAGEIALRTQTINKNYEAREVEVVSSIGSGDNLNAGIIFGLIKEGIRHQDLASLSEKEWDKLIGYAITFSTEVCRSYDNSISPSFAESYRINITKQ